MTSSKLTRRKADRHEAVYVRLARLARQIEAMALRQPALGVPDSLRVAAETLLYDLAPFLPGPRGLGAAAPDMAGLAAQLGQGLAGLDVFEAVNTAWNPEIKARVWLLPGKPLVVRRHHPATTRIETDQQRQAMTAMRSTVYAQLNRKAAQSYREGYEDGSTGRPFLAPSPWQMGDKNPRAEKLSP